MSSSQSLSQKLSQSVAESLVVVLLPKLAGLLASGDNWTLTLHGGKGGDVKVEVRTTAMLLSPKGERVKG